MKEIDTLRLAFLSTHSSPIGPPGSRDTGGMSTYLLGLSKALGNDRHQVDIFTRRVADGFGAVEQLFPNVRLIALDDRLGELDKYALFPQCAVIADSIDRFSRQEGTFYQAIFSHYWISGSVGSIISKRLQVPHLVMFHTLGRAKNEACSGEDEPAVRIEEEKRLASEADRIVVAAGTEKERIGCYYDISPEKIALITCGLDRNLFRPGDREAARRELGFQQGKIILFVGRIEPLKGLDLLIQSLALLPAAINYKLLVVGGDQHSSLLVGQLKAEALRLGLNEKIVFAGLVDHKKLPLYYQAAAVTVMPSAYESFGLVALESIACGTRVIAGPVGIIPELVAPDAQNGPVLLVPERKPAPWAAAIEKVLTHPGPPDPVPVDSLLAPFNWQLASEQLIKLCCSLIKN